MIKVTIFYDDTKESNELKPIEFIHFIDTHSEQLFKAKKQPKDFKTIELIKKKTTIYDFDVMLAYDDVRDVGNLYLGHFNDGVVE